MKLLDLVIHNIKEEGSIQRPSFDFVNHVETLPLRFEILELCRSYVNNVSACVQDSAHPHAVLTTSVDFNFKCFDELGPSTHICSMSNAVPSALTA